MKYLLPLIFLILIAVSFQYSYAYTQIIGPINYSGTPFNLGNNAVNFGNNDSFSFKFTMQRNNVIANECIICKVDNSFYTQGWNIQTDGQLLIVHLNGQNANDVTYTDMIMTRSLTTIDDNKPQDILITYNGNGSAKGVIIYINGTASNQQILFNNLSTTIKNQKNAYVGSMPDGTSSKFTGTISNLYLYSGVYSNSPQTITKSLSDSVTIYNSVSLQQSTATYPQIMNVASNNGITQCPTNYKLIGMITSNNTGICGYDDTELKLTRYDNAAAYFAGKINEWEFCGDPNNKTNQFYPDYNLAWRGDKCWNASTHSYSGYKADGDIACISDANYSCSFRLGSGGNYTFSITKRPGGGILEFIHHAAINGPAIQLGYIDLQDGSFHWNGHMYGIGNQLIK